MILNVPLKYIFNKLETNMATKYSLTKAFCNYLSFVGRIILYSLCMLNQHFDLPH